LSTFQQEFHPKLGHEDPKELEGQISLRETPSRESNAVVTASSFRPLPIPQEVLLGPPEAVTIATWGRARERLETERETNWSIILGILMTFLSQ
jgi:hypothetical protein